MVTTLFNSSGPADASHIGNSCGATRAALTARGMKASAPITAVLGGMDINGVWDGGISWFLKGHEGVELLECNLNAGEDLLLVTHHETSSNGIDESAVGKSCMEVLATRKAAGLQASGPIPIPQGQPDENSLLFVSDPGVGISGGSGRAFAV